MALNKRHSLWILLVPIFAYAIWYFVDHRRQPAAEQPAAPAVDDRSVAPKAPEPTFVPVDESSLRGFSAGNEYVLSGKVTSEEGEALGGAVVSVYGSPPRWAPPAFEQPVPLDTQTCDADGNYQIRLDIPANLWIGIRKDGFAAIDAFIPVRDVRTAVRDYQLRPAQSNVGGLVLDKEDKPIAGALVVANTPPFVSVADSPTFTPIARITDSAGKYTMEGLPDGDVSIVASVRGHLQEEELGVLRSGQSQQIDLHLPPANPLSFLVKNARGEVLPYATATAPGYFKMAGGDKRGVIEFSVPLDLNPFECTMVAEGHNSAKIQLDPRAAPSVVVLEERPVLKGRVIKESGQGVEGALVSVFGTGGAQGKFDGAVRTDKGGRFSLSLLYPPVREIRASLAGYFDQRLAFDAGKPVPAETVIRLKRVEAGIFGRVIDYRGISVRRFVVHIRDAAAKSGSPEYQRSFNSENGRFTITDVTPGTYNLIIQSLQSTTTDDVQLVRLDRVEIRKGFLFGEIVAQFPKPQFSK